MDKQTAQILGSQYIRGNSDARPAPGYSPTNQASGPYQEVYHEGFADATRHVKTIVDAPTDYLRKDAVPGAGDKSPQLAYDVVAFLRKVQSDLGVHGAKRKEDVYNSLNVALADWIADSDAREREETIAREVRAEVERRVGPAVAAAVAAATAKTEPPSA